MVFFILIVLYFLKPAHLDAGQFIILVEENVMVRNTFKPFLFIAVMLMVVSLACSVDLTGTKTPEPPQPIIQPTQQQPPIQLPTQQQIQPPPQEASPIPPSIPPQTTSQFFKEDFTSDVLANWTNFVSIGDTKSDSNKAKVSVENGKLVFDLTDNYLYSYLIYDKNTYGDVRVEVSADNRGKNNNNVSLICRYTDDGWYEFNIANNGLFNILAYDAKGRVHKGYNALVTDGSNAIKMGMETNVYVIECKGNTLKLFINGEESASFNDKKYGFSDGKVGISVSSFNVYPIIVEVDYFDIQQP
jgi:hypothetical protein